MKVHRDLAVLPVFKNAVLTIGSFDGVHAGHQEILKRLNTLAKEIGGESILITFDPHPRLVVYPDDNTLKLISTVEEKAKLLEQYGIDHMVVVNFTKEFSKQSPDEYICNFLVEKFHPKRIVIGYDHKFGNKRAGNIDYLRNFEKEFGFSVEEIDKQAIEDIAVSSTKVRNALLEGDIQAATALLNHSFSLSGIIEKGKQLGKSIGFPTANLKIQYPYKIIPAIGIYAVRVWHKSTRYNGMLYIGKSLDNEQVTIEVNIFDFNKEIYEDSLRLEFVDFVRKDIRFDSVKALTEQLKKDQTKVLAIFNSIDKE